MQVTVNSTVARFHNCVHAYKIVLVWTDYFNYTMHHRHMVHTSFHPHTYTPQPTHVHIPALPVGTVPIPRPLKRPPPRRLLLVPEDEGSV